MRLTLASFADAEWLGDTLSRISRPLGPRVEPTPEGTLVLRWSEDTRRTRQPSRTYAILYRS